MTRNIFRAYDLIGNIALVKFSDRTRLKDKKQYAKKIMSENKSIKTVLEKIGKFKGRLRKQETNYIAGEKTKEVLYRENGCVFRFNIDKTYFSPRLSNERKEVSSQIKPNEIVLVMFAGIAPFPITIAKKTKVQKVYSNEINKEANKYAKLNIELNKVKNKVVLLPGDIKKTAEKIKQGLIIEDNEVPSEFDVIIMPRPQLKESFLEQAFTLSKKGTRIFYYDFCKKEEIDSFVEKLKNQAKKFDKKIKITRVKKAGEIGAYKFRIRIDFEIL